MEDIRNNEELAVRMGFAWALGLHTLYKFKGFSGDQRHHVADMLEHSRVYFSVADQFNDPLDVAPVVALGGDPGDPAFVAELVAKEDEILRARGLDDGQIESFRRKNGTDITKLPSLVRDDLRAKLRADARIFCLTAEQCHPLQWAHYADHHRGVCLHFGCERGQSLGLARKVSYRKDRAPILLPLERQSHETIVERMALVKAEYWGYEEEYRIIGDASVEWGAKLENRYLQVDRESLKGVTIGMRMSKADEAELMTLIDKHRPGLPVWRAIEDYDRFWMRVERAG